ncbi:MAG: XRE family transcriptional regulator [Clostridia bacterium]|nr:XRE family transcriptional regulator [Clostridia bacterium]
MVKDTAELIKELDLCPDFKTFYEENESQLLQKELPALLEELMKGISLSKTDVIRNSGLNEIYAYQIFSGKRKPSRKKLLALAVGMQLAPSHVQELLRCAGYAPLYVKLPYDSVVIYGICKKMSVPEINELLFRYCKDFIG